MAGLKFLLVALLLLGSPWLAASEELKVVALFKNAAMVEFNGKQKLYRVGQELSPGIKLLAADTRSATFMVNGKKQELGLQATTSFSGDASAAGPQPKQLSKVASIVRNNYGMYKTGGFINGVAVTFLVDTGASQVAMNENIAKQVGLLYKMHGERTGVSTANGVTSAWRITLNKIRVGGIELQGVDALVIKGTGPNEVLLGMSFLNRVKMEDNGQLLKLIQKY